MADTERTVVEFFLQCQQPDGTWENASSAMDAQDWAETRLARRRQSTPDWEWRVIRRTTTTSRREEVIEPENGPTDPVRNASYPREGGSA